MGQVIWMASGVTVAAVVFGIGLVSKVPPQKSSETFETAYVTPEMGGSDAFFIGTNGSALASAAFGLSALQPETYNGEIVLDIIDASPLNIAEKERLAERLFAAETGDADLRRVLSDVRVSLAVE